VTQMNQINNGSFFKPELEDSYLCHPGPWGRLEYVRILISPPREFIEHFEQDKLHRAWHFPYQSPSSVQHVLVQMGWRLEDVTKLFHNSEVTCRETGTDILPAPSFIRGLDPELRAILYRWLANQSDESNQKNAFRFFGSSLEEWIRGIPLRPETVELLRPYVYRQGALLMFADLPAVVEKIHDTHEAALLMQALSREMTMLVNLHVQPNDDIQALVNYWGRSKRRKDITPILESLSHFRSGHSIDIVHLLPWLPRKLLYTYPRPGIDRYERERTCYWTALNFFNDEPDDRLLDLRFVQQTIEREWSVVKGEPLLGDVALFHEEGTEVIHHAAVYVADNILFSKNGPGLVRPWMLVQAEYLQEFYYRNARLGIRYYRRNDLL
jgi:hypothetical protein